MTYQLGSSAHPSSAPPLLMRLMLTWLSLAVLSAGEPPQLIPAFSRIDLAVDATGEVVLTLKAPPGTSATAGQVDCACLKLVSALPAQVGSSGTLEIRLRASGIRPGVESIIIATTAGAARAELQIVGPGAGTGLAVLKEALAKASAGKLSLWGVVHSLNGQTRNCGCSKGSLGGIGHLAALPAQAAALSPGVSTRWVLSGDYDGKRPGVGAALAERGWKLGDPAVVVAPDPVPFLAVPGLTAVIPTDPSAVNHRRILRPVLTGGLIVDLLLVDAAGNVQDHRVMPVDSTLADAPEVAALFPDPMTFRIDMAASPSTACASCHSSAHTAWTSSKHAHALESLVPADRTDACISCHTTPVAEKTVAPGVSCQSCHAGSEAHLGSVGTIKTTAVDCRTCHDAKHHPAFDREKGWKVIRHGMGTKP